VGRSGTGGIHRGFWKRNLKEIAFLEGLGFDGANIKKYHQEVLWGLGWSGSEWKQMARFFECGNDMSVSVTWECLTRWGTLSFSRSPRFHAVSFLLRSQSGLRLNQSFWRSQFKGLVRISSIKAIFLYWLIILYCYNLLIGHVGAETGRRSINYSQNVLDVTGDNLEFCDW